MALRTRISIQHTDFDMGEETAALQAGDAAVGAVASFIGLVRGHGDRDGVEGLYLEHFPGMTEQVIADLITEAAGRWDLLGATVIHRVGELQLGDRIVLVAVSSSHRPDAFSACEFLMDALKTMAPFWKKERTATGAYWVEQKTSDQERASQWAQSAGTDSTSSRES